MRQRVDDDVDSDGVGFDREFLEVVFVFRFPFPTVADVAERLPQPFLDDPISHRPGVLRTESLTYNLLGDPASKLHIPDGARLRPFIEGVGRERVDINEP